MRFFSYIPKKERTIKYCWVLLFSESNSINVSSFSYPYWLILLYRHLFLPHSLSKLLFQALKSETWWLDKKILKSHHNRLHDWACTLVQPVTFIFHCFSWSIALSHLYVTHYGVFSLSTRLFQSKSVLWTLVQHNETGLKLVGKIFWSICEEILSKM